MKKMIIVVGISMLFILTAMSSIGVNVNGTDIVKPNAQIPYYVTIHVFYDTDKDGEQDPDEINGGNNNDNAKAWFSCALLSIDPEANKFEYVDESGDATFEILPSTTFFAHGCGYYQEEGWRRFTGPHSPDDNMVVNVPLRQYTGVPISKNLVYIKIFTLIEKIFEDHPLLLLLQKW